MIHWTKPQISCSFPCINTHEVLCVDHLWLNVDVERVGYGADPFAFIFNFIWDLYKEVVHKQAYTRFYQFGYFLAYVHFHISMHSFINEAPGQ